MGFSTNGIPHIIQCGSDTSDHVCLPRGSEDKLQELLKESGIPYHITEKKQKGRSIHVEFTGKLYQEQENAAERMLQYTYGILGAATGFGNKWAIANLWNKKRKKNKKKPGRNAICGAWWLEDEAKSCWFAIVKECLVDMFLQMGKTAKRTWICSRQRPMPFDVLPIHSCHVESVIMMRNCG